jgi:hypothetical protein
MKKALYIICISLIAWTAQGGEKKKKSAQQAPPKLNSAALGKIDARHIGPAVTGGRITAIDGVNADPRIMYIGTAGGGVWKTTSGGSGFTSVFDKYCQSIGSIAI